MNSQTIPSFHQRTAPWLLAVAAFVVLLLFFFFPVIFQSKVIAPLDILDHLMRPWSDGSGGFGVHNAMVYDAISQYLPYDWTVCQSLKQDGFIGWNPYVYGGYPLLENTMLCPGDWHHQLYRFLEFWTAWNLGILLQFTLAGIGMIVMLRGEGLSASAALLGSIAFAFYSQHVIWIYHRWVLGTSCWFPWMIWAIRRARCKNRWVDPLSIVFTALAFRGGSLQSCLFVVLLVGCLVAADVWEHDKDLKRKCAVGRFLVFYISLAILSTILTLDILLNTVVPCLHGSRTLTDRSLVQLVKALPHNGTLLLPSFFGSPKTMDLGKAFGADMFETKFLGVAVFVIACFSLFHRKAPLAAKLCLCISLAITATPLMKWFYARSTVVFAFGCIWLAAWAVDHAPEVVSPRAWRWIARSGMAIVSLWIAAGIAVTILMPRLLPIVHRYVIGSQRVGRESRIDWMLDRADAFLAEFPPWASHNAVQILFAVFGLLAFWFLNANPGGWKRRRVIWFATLSLCTFGELFAWSRSWITFSDRPDTGKAETLYSLQPWATDLRKEMTDGGLLWIHDRASDFDYLQLNAQVGIGIASAQGYETIRPQTLSDPENWQQYDPTAFSERGISHVLVHPGAEPPHGLSAWKEVVNDSSLHLYRNPSFTSRWHAVLEGGETIPLRDDGNSPSRHCFLLPAGAIGVTFAEPFHKDWNTRLDDPVVSPFKETVRPDGGTSVVWNHPVSEGTVLVRSFRAKP